jgi:hypothetical protein
VRFRPLAAAAVLTAAALLLTSCRTNAGTAATVDGHRITESSVNGYVIPAGPTSAVVAQAAQNGTTIAPKSIIVQFLVLQQLFRATLAGNGGVPNAGTLSASHDKAIALLQSNAGASGSAFDREISTELVQSGISDKLRPVYIEIQELEYTLVERLKLSSPADVVATIAKQKLTVRVNPRYGKWSPSQLALDQAGSVPSYLKLQTGTTALPAA